MKTRLALRAITLLFVSFVLIVRGSNCYPIELRAVNETAGIMVEVPRTSSKDSVTVERLLIKNGKVVLDGLLVLPNFPGKKSVIIFLGGSGEWEIVDAYLKNPEESYGSLTRFYIEQRLMQKGYGMLYLNKRGFGRATGKWRKIGIEGRASDALAAFEFLRHHPQVDPNSIGMAGHSQGGWVAQLAASQNPNVAFSISFAGPSMSVYDQTLLSDEYSWNCERLSQKKKNRKRFFRKLELGVGGALGKVIGGEAGHWARLRK
jgi:pimeloyl-ACP methyl ester carboxylesterase